LIKSTVGLTARNSVFVFCFDFLTASKTPQSVFTALLTAVPELVFPAIVYLYLKTAAERFPTGKLFWPTANRKSFRPPMTAA